MKLFACIIIIIVTRYNIGLNFGTYSRESRPSITPAPPPSPHGGWSLVLFHHTTTARRLHPLLSSISPLPLFPRPRDLISNESHLVGRAYVSVTCSCPGGGGASAVLRGLINDVGGRTDGRTTTSGARRPPPRAGRAHATRARLLYAACRRVDLCCVVPTRRRGTTRSVYVPERRMAAGWRRRRMQPPYSRFNSTTTTSRRVVPLDASIAIHASSPPPPPRSEEHYIVQKSTDGVDLAWYIIERWCGAVAFLLSPLTDEPATTSGVAWPWRGVAFSLHYFHSRNR